MLFDVSSPFLARAITDVHDRLAFKESPCVVLQKSEKETQLLSSHVHCLFVLSNKVLCALSASAIVEDP